MKSSLSPSTQPYKRHAASESKKTVCSDEKGAKNVLQSSENDDGEITAKHDLSIDSSETAATFLLDRDSNVSIAMDSFLVCFIVCVVR